jgi:hypothetical protein
MSLPQRVDKLKDSIMKITYAGLGVAFVWSVLLGLISANIIKIIPGH